MAHGGSDGAPTERGRGLVSAGCLVDLPSGAVYEVPAGARVTPLAEEEARRRGIRLLRSDAPAPGAGVALVRGLLDAGACRVGLCPPDPTRPGDLASAIDHTLLRADATVADVDQLCAEALEHGFASVCVNGTWVRRASEVLGPRGPLVCAVAGFPLGATAPEVKVFEAERALADGACEIDMVLNIGALRSGDDAFVLADIAGVAAACHRHRSARLKVILETCLLDDPEKERACRLAVAAGADYVKTSTGFGSAGATLADVALLRRVVGPRVGVKAAGGVRDLAAAEEMLRAGADRIGASASVEIVRYR